MTETNTILYKSIILQLKINTFKNKMKKQVSGQGLWPKDFSHFGTLGQQRLIRNIERKVLCSSLRMLKLYLFNMKTIIQYDQPSKRTGPVQRGDNPIKQAVSSIVGPNF